MMKRAVKLPHRILSACPPIATRHCCDPRHIWSRIGISYSPGRSRKTFRTLHTNAAVLETVLTSLRQLQGGADGVGAFLESAPPPCYLIYLLAAGFGLPCSEDALVAWVGANIARSLYGGAQQTVWVLCIVYLGVVVSDMITFGIGALLKQGFFRSLKDSLFKDSDRLDKVTAMIHRWSRAIGLIQRFSLGFRGPLCLVCGFTGVKASQFLGGVALGALGTMPIQLLVGYLLRDSPSPYFAALAIAAGPNMVGHVIGPLATAVGFIWTSRKPDEKDGEGMQQEPEAA